MRIAVLVVVACLAGLVVLAVGVALGHAAERRRLARRGGLLELDSWEARNALTLRAADDHLPRRPSKPSHLRRCNPERGVHYHGHGDRCECGERPSINWTTYRDRTLDDSGSDAA